MISFEHVSFTYPGADRPAISNLSFELMAGELVLIVGPSGAGKSTLLRCLNGLVPHFSGGDMTGNIRVNGLDPVTATPQIMSRHVGFVFQDPEAQFVMDRVEDELAFALENAAMPPQEMRVRVEETLDLLDLEPLRDRPLATLSGGEKQRVAIAAALALRPEILVLDEPTSQLDPKSAEDVLTALTRLNQDLGLTVLLAEHRLERVLHFVDSLLYLSDSDEPTLVGDPREVLLDIPLGPPLVQLGKALTWRPLPLTVKEGLRFSRRQQRAAVAVKEKTEHDQAKESTVAVNGAVVRYGDYQALNNVSCQVCSGETVVLMGRNGAGKTTLLKSMIGLVRPNRGTVSVANEDIAGKDVADICRNVGYLPQDPNTLLFADTVLDELEITLRNHGLHPDQGGTPPIEPRQLLQQLGLAHKEHAYPRDLSVGERQRVALAAITITQPGTLLLDEPTRGLDYLAKAQLEHLLQDWRLAGMAIVVITHDVEFAAVIADRVMLMSQGEIIADGPPSEVMASSPLFAPQISRLFPASGWLTTDDVVIDR